ncbi:hypothetical protein [Polyangium jinanense]|uniref:FG-GAP repeat protein n=1 Tax=Polyangium jinanense TaxID=2829994 RepID=A0A9X4ATX8_9BACT|nr:hypothetical protein [Polyangium jinanense]MDC3959056.1 hypothetical protein [Polyangium jinanense]MDC3984021.1 hypothetical protein [Polyangium jinanense]
MRRASPSALAPLVALPLLPACAPPLQDPPPPFEERPVGELRAAAVAKIEGMGPRTITDVAVLPSGEPVLVGHCSGELHLGDSPTPCPGKEAFFLIELSPAGAIARSLVAGELGTVHPVDVATRTDGSVVVVGEFAGALDLGSTRLESTSGEDAFLTVLDGFAPGETIGGEAMRFGDTGEQIATSVAVAEGHGIMLAGAFSGVVGFGGPALESEGDYDVFIASRTAGGSPRWSTRLGGPLVQQAIAIAARPDGGAVVVGAFEGSIGAGTVWSAGGKDVFVAAIDAAGGPGFTLALGDAVDDEEAAGVVVDALGQTVVLGSFGGSVGHGATLATARSERAAFVAAVDPQGALVKIRSFGETGVTRGRAMAPRPGGGTYLALDFTGRVEVGDRVFESKGAEDVLVLELDASLRAVRAGAFGDMYTQRATGMAVDGEGRVFLVGDFEGTLLAGEDAITASWIEPFWMRIDAWSGGE